MRDSLYEGATRNTPKVLHPIAQGKIAASLSEQDRPPGIELPPFILT
ncbi:hypothetical protein [Adhaeretor mobilis]|uniref:Uncharacterized protein n=1 Tax=Adhaeretor mobilis TaxID=1930276 RepID=A0A517MPM6_9BACT|nr:hypothetical protein [Adhaeretor mobilis]QDS96824.1 hypothetical protein HG15A2_00820 [Adhaeretor mobilis]